jgi:hypothetical protein
LHSVRTVCGPSAVNDRQLVIKALEMALRRRCPDSGLLHHCTPHL